MDRASIWVKLAALAVLAFVATVAKDFVDQQRVEIIGQCPPSWSGDMPSLLVYDYRDNVTACVQLPTKKPAKLGVHYGK